MDNFGIVFHYKLKKHMELRKDDFPIALQAYDIHENSVDFVAEQVVKTEEEAENFMSRYPGKLISARNIESEKSKRLYDINSLKNDFPVWAVFLGILLVILMAALLSGWLQKQLGL
jgi:hypothetical protein